MINATYTSVSFNWTAPRDTGRSKISAYHLKIAQLNKTRNERNNTMMPMKNALLEYTFYNLQKDTSYQISVSAYTRAGQGKIRMATFKTPRKAKGKPKD